MSASESTKEKDNNDKDDGQVVTMVDVLQEENELEEDANAVLGGADDKMCTYSKVYDLSCGDRYEYLYFEKW